VGPAGGGVEEDWLKVRLLTMLGRE
jgi:hypothetical protein